MILTVAQFREHMGDDVALSDDVLTVMLDANEAAITRRIGPPAGAVETVYGYGTTLLTLRSTPQTITSVTDYFGTTGTVFTEDTDFRVRGSGLLRIDGTWGERTVVEYLPANNAAERIVVLVQLMKCDLNYEPGMLSQSGGGAFEAYTSGHMAEREAILDRLGSVLFA